METAGFRVAAQFPVIVAESISNARKKSAFFPKTGSQEAIFAAIY
jgi:hypothetical protein